MAGAIFEHDDNLRGAKTLEDKRIEISGIESPDLLAVHAYWETVRGEKFAPSLAEFNLIGLPADVIPFVSVVDFQAQPFDYRFRFYGTKLVEASGMELTGKWYNADHVEGFGFANAQTFPTMIESRRPVASRTVWLSRKSIKYVSTILRLPLSRDGEAVTNGVAAYHFG